jgi:hypothetical protein
MNQMKQGTNTRISAAIIVAALIVTAGILIAVSPFGLVGERTVTSTVVTTTTSLMTITNLPSTATTTTQLHKVIFNESAVCDNDYPDRWAVTLADITISQPANVTFPFSKGAQFGSAGEAVSKIVFTMPDGTYNWNVSALTSLVPASGTIGVNGSDVEIQIQVEPPGFCGGGLG